MGWTEERVENLRAFWALGLSAGQIATKLGDTTRNAVIGKVHRLGLPERKSYTRPVKRRHKTQKIKIEINVGGQPVSRQIPLADLELNECRWIIGEGYPYLCCGHSKHGDSLYCKHHTARATKPETERVKRDAERVLNFYTERERRAA